MGFTKTKSTIVLFVCIQFSSLVSAQFDPYQNLYPELSAGLKVSIGEVQYGSRYGERSVPGPPLLQPTIRYDFPFRLWTIRDKTFWLSLTASTGVLYVPVKKQIINNLDPVTGNPVTYSTKSPLYIPFYFGFYNPGAFGLGVEAFYAKGLGGVSDIWGGKMLGISYSHSKFRIDAAYELAVPVKFKVDSPIWFVSLDFLWKLGNRDE